MKAKPDSVASFTTAKSVADREIAARYCPDSKILAGLFNEVERLQAQKEQSVLQQDFENAVLRRDEEEKIAKQIDALLFDSVGK